MSKLLTQILAIGSIAAVAFALLIVLGGINISAQDVVDGEQTLVDPPEIRSNTPAGDYGDKGAGKYQGGDAYGGSEYGGDAAYGSGGHDGAGEYAEGWSSYGGFGSPRSADSRIVVYLTDGSMLVGTPADAERLTFKTSFGDAAIPLSVIQGIRLKAERGFPQIVLFKNGDQLTVRPTFDRIKLHTMLGPVTLRNSQIESLTNAPQPMVWLSENSRWRFVPAGLAPRAEGYGSEYGEDAYGDAYEMESDYGGDSAYGEEDYGSESGLDGYSEEEYGEEHNSPNDEGGYEESAEGEAEYLDDESDGGFESPADGGGLRGLSPEYDQGESAPEFDLPESDADSYERERIEIRGLDEPESFEGLEPSEPKNVESGESDEPAGFEIEPAPTFRAESLEVDLTPAQSEGPPIVSERFEAYGPIQSER